MASLMEELLGVLEKEETEYLTLIDLADVKSQAIIKADIAKLGEVTEKEQEDVFYNNAKKLLKL